MEIAVLSKEILIDVRDNSVNLQIIRNFTRKSFGRVLTLNNTIIIFHQEQELRHKKYFLQWAYAAYKKSRKNLSRRYLELLQNHCHLPVKIRIQGTKKVVESVKITLHFSGKRVRVVTDPRNTLLEAYFRGTFKPWLEESEPGNTIISLEQRKPILLLEKLMERNRIVNVPLFFIYDRRKWAEITGDSRQALPVTEEEARLARCYSLLESTRNDTADQIKKNYIRLAKTYHPDRVFGQGDDVIALYTSRFQSIQEAYQTVLALAA